MSQSNPQVTTAKIIPFPMLPRKSQIREPSSSDYGISDSSGWYHEQAMKDPAKH